MTNVKKWKGHRKHIFSPLKNERQSRPNNFLFDSNQLLYLFKDKFKVCDYKPECFMSLGWVVDDIIMNIFTSTAFSDKIKFNKNFFSNITDGNIFMYKGYLQDYMWKKLLIIELNWPMQFFCGYRRFLSVPKNIFSIIFSGRIQDSLWEQELYTTRLDKIEDSNQPIWNICIKFDT